MNKQIKLVFLHFKKLQAGQRPCKDPMKAQEACKLQWCCPPSSFLHDGKKPKTMNIMDFPYELREEK